MEKIRGTNFGNWLVLEKWMQPQMFEGVDAEDEIWLNRLMDPEKLAERMKEHRDTYVTEDDFRIVAEHGINLIRIPVPYFIFGDRPPLIGCIEYLDKAFDWAEKYGLTILIDLHTVPGSQNGYDNGGLTGVCKWYKDKKEVRFALSVLERLAKRYKDRKGLYGIEVLNEPISFLVWVSSPSFRAAADKNEAKGSWFVPLPFLKAFYRAAYKRLRAILPEDKVIVFHDGFRLTKWNRYFDQEKMKNVMLDTHIYIFAMENFVPIRALWAYKIYVGFNRLKIRNVKKHIPVVVGEWCISNKYANNLSPEIPKDPGLAEKQRRRYRQVADLQLKAWDESAGHIYWNYQLWRDLTTPLDLFWKESWALNRCWDREWMPPRM